MRIETEIENGFSKMFSDKIEEYKEELLWALILKHKIILSKKKFKGKDRIRIIIMIL